METFYCKKEYIYQDLNEHEEGIDCISNAFELF